ncbi:MAG TPA: type II secretion system protein [Parachlamydiaceae bacterium]|nr:type II secretion system protein [Parachlamydiaceae bacterium]
MKKNSKKLPKYQKRTFLLFEVLIAFALIALFAIPLISPHISMLKAQKELEIKTRINHAANIIYVHLVEKMHKNEIALQDIEEGKILAVQAELLQGILGYRAFYSFKIDKSKKKDDDSLAAYVAVLKVTFKPLLAKKQEMNFETPVFLCSKKSGSQDQSANGAESDKI